MVDNSVSITWRTQRDDRVCPVCRDIDGYTWTFTDIPPESLVHPKWGEVWNVTIGSLAHEQHLGKGGVNFSTCRCHVDGKVESLAGFAREIRRLKEELKAALNPEGTTQP